MNNTIEKLKIRLRQQNTNKMIDCNIDINEKRCQNFDLVEESKNYIVEQYQNDRKYYYRTRFRRCSGLFGQYCTKTVFVQIFGLCELCRKLSSQQD